MLLGGTELRVPRGHAAVNFRKQADTLASLGRRLSALIHTQARKGFRRQSATTREARVVDGTGVASCQAPEGSAFRWPPVE